MKPWNKLIAMVSYRPAIERPRYFLTINVAISSVVIIIKYVTIVI